MVEKYLNGSLNNWAGNNLLEIISFQTCSTKIHQDDSRTNKYYCLNSKTNSLRFLLARKKIFKSKLTCFLKTGRKLDRSINAHPPRRMLTFPCKSVSKWLVLLAAPLAVVVTLYSDETTSSWCHALVPLRPSEVSSITNIVIVSRDVSLKRLIFFFLYNLIKLGIIKFRLDNWSKG